MKSGLGGKAEDIQHMYLLRITHLVIIELRFKVLAGAVVLSEARLGKDLLLSSRG